MLIRIFGAYLSVIAFSIILEIPKRLILYAGITGAIGWAVYLIAQSRTPSNVAVAFISSVVISILSHIFARWLKAPTTIFLVAGILPSVPGGSIYRSAYYLISNDSVLSDYYFMETLQIAGAIAMALFLVESVMRIRRK